LIEAVPANCAGSSDPSVASCGGDGVAANNEGTATITGRTTDSYPTTETCSTTEQLQRGAGLTVFRPELVGSVPQPLVSGDGDATISGQMFTFKIQAVKPGTNPPQVVSSYNQIVSLDFPLGAPIQGESGFPAQVQLSGGQANTQVVLKIVQDTLRGRIYTITGNGATAGSGIVNVWFSVGMDIERWKNCNFAGCPNLGSYFCTTACVSSGFAQPTSFIALTARVCNSSVIVRFANPSTQVTTTRTTTVQDVGPQTNNAYWNTGSIPSIGGCLSEVLATDLGVDNGCRGTTPYGHGTVLWRFQ